jgi:hypothetical protein
MSRNHASELLCFHFLCSRHRGVDSNPNPEDDETTQVDDLIDKIYGLQVKYLEDGIHHSAESLYNLNEEIQIHVPIRDLLKSIC